MTLRPDDMTPATGAPDRTIADGVGRIGDCALEAVDRFATPLFLGLAGLIVALCGALAYFLSIEPDEAWVLMSTANAFGILIAPSSALDNPTITSGGLHLLLHGLVALVSPSILLHRLVSLIAAVALLALAWRIFQRFGHTVRDCALGVAALAAVPGLALQASLALAEILAVPLVIAASLHWTFVGRRRLAGALLSGVIAGLACATRINCVILLPAIGLLAFVSERGLARRIGLPLACIAMALVTMLLTIAAYIMATGGLHLAALTHYVSASTGVGGEAGRPGIGHYLMFLTVANGLLPFGLIGLLLAGFAIGARHREPARNYLAGLLLAYALIGMLAWLAKSPLPHLRYLWPSISTLWLAGLLILLPVIDRGAAARRLVQTAVIFACLAQMLRILLAIESGDSLTLVYQSVGASPLSVPTHTLRAAADERAITAAVTQLPDDARIYTPTAPSAYSIAYLSGHAIENVQTAPGFAGAPSYLLILPANVTTWRPDADFDAWSRRWTAPVEGDGGYALRRIDPAAPAPRFTAPWIGEY